MLSWFIPWIQDVRKRLYPNVRLFCGSGNLFLRTCAPLAFTSFSLSLSLSLSPFAGSLSSSKYSPRDTHTHTHNAGGEAGAPGTPPLLTSLHAQAAHGRESGLAVATKAHRSRNAIPRQSPKLLICEKFAGGNRFDNKWPKRSASIGRS